MLIADEERYPVPGHRPVVVTLSQGSFNELVDNQGNRHFGELEAEIVDLTTDQTRLEQELKAAKKDTPKEDAPKKDAPKEDAPKKDDDEAKDESAEEKPAPAKKPKVGSPELEKESTKHAVIVSAKAKLTGNIKESESSQSGTKIVATSTAKHNRETVLETHVPIHHTSEVALAGSAGPVISEKAPEDMKKPTVVKQGSLNE